MVRQNSSRLTETLDLLTHPHRRYALYCLTNESKGISVDTLATGIAEFAEGQTAAGGSTDRKSLEIALRHTHLPKLADGGIVSIGANTGLIELRDTERLDRYLTDMARIDGYTQPTASD